MCILVLAFPYKWDNSGCGGRGLKDKGFKFSKDFLLEKCFKIVLGKSLRKCLPLRVNRFNCSEVLREKLKTGRIAGAAAGDGENYREEKIYKAVFSSYSTEFHGILVNISFE